MLNFIKKIFGIKEAVDVVEEPVKKVVKRVKKPKVIKEEAVSKVSDVVEIKEVVKKVPKRTKKELVEQGPTVVTFVPKKRGRPKKAK